MKEFLFPTVIVMAIILAGCFYQRPVEILIPNDSTALRSPDSTVWRPDPTRVIFRNHSLNIHLRIWANKNPTGAPDLELGPEEAKPFNFHRVGTQIVYISGRESMISGWKNLGTEKKSLEISPFSTFGSAREIPIGDWDFAEYYYRHSR